MTYENMPRQPTREMILAGVTAYNEVNEGRITAIWQAMHDAFPGGWQPIDSAPTDGTPIMLHISGNGHTTGPIESIDSYKDLAFFRGMGYTHWHWAVQPPARP